MALSAPDVSTPLSSPVGPFSRLCQVAILIGTSLDHWTALDTARRLGRYVDLDEGKSQLKKLNDLRNILAPEISPSSTPLSPLLVPYCLVESAIVLIQDFYSCPVSIKHSVEYSPTEEDIKAQIHAVQELREVSLRLTGIARKVLGHTEGGQDLVLLNPMICDSMYCAGATMDWLYRESGDAEAEECLGVMKMCLERFGTRWRVGSEYLKVLDQHDIAVRLSMNM